MSQKKSEKNNSTNLLEMKKQEDENLQITSSQSMDDLRLEVKILLMKAKANRTKKNDDSKKNNG
jgi:hypothetical protein